MTGPSRGAAAAVAAVLCMALAGCSGTTADAPPFPTATTAPSIASGCTPPQVLRQVDGLLAGQDFEAHALTIGGKLTLSVWLVDPAIDPTTPPSSMAATGNSAAGQGLTLSYRLVDRIPCVARVFDQINPMIVDRAYQHWYKDFLPVGAFAGVRDPTPEGLRAAIEAMGTTLQPTRTDPPPASATPLPGSCEWPQARAAIHDYLGADENSAAYLIIGAGLVRQADGTVAANDVGVEVQWSVDGPAGSRDAAIRERLGHVAAAIACLRTPVDSLEAFVVDRHGRTLVYAAVPGSSTRTPNGTKLDGLRIYHL